MIQLLEQHHFLTATQLLEKLRSQGIVVNKTSVYRNLDSFLEDDRICRQSFGEDEFVYELQSGHHDHVQCKVCGKVAEVPCQVSSSQKIAGYVVDHHHLTLYGLCATCQEK